MVYGVAQKNNVVNLLPYQNQGKTITVIASTLLKCMAKFMWTSLPLLSIESNSIQLLSWKKGYL